MSNRWGGGSGKGGSGTGTVSKITSSGGSVGISNPTGPTVNLEVGVQSTQGISGTTGSADLLEYENPAGGTFTVLIFNNYTNTSPETLTFDLAFFFGNVGIPSWGSAAPSLTLSLTQVGIPVVTSSITGVFIVMGS